MLNSQIDSKANYSFLINTKYISKFPTIHSFPMLPATKENMQVDQSFTQFSLPEGGGGEVGKRLLDDCLFFLDKEFNAFLFKIIHLIL